MVRFFCENGHKIKAPDEYAGRKAKCPNPKCGLSVVIPAAGEEKLVHHSDASIANTRTEAQVAVGSKAQEDATGQTPDTTKPCPYCGETILVIAKKCKHCGEVLDRDPKSTQYKTTPSTIDEKIIWQGSPSHLNYILYYILGVLMTPIFGVGFIMMVWAYLDKRNRQYIVTNKRIILRAGIIERMEREVTIADIRCVYTNQDILDRLFGLGSIKVGTAGTAQIEINFFGVEQPMQVKKIISDLKIHANNGSD